MNEEGRVLSVHFGRSANCSSIGSVVDVLFVSSIAGAAVLSSVAILMVRNRREREKETIDTGRPREEEE